MNESERRILRIAWCGVIALLWIRPGLAADPDAKAILSVMERVADWQLAHPSEHRPDDWTQAAGYAGMMALDGISGRKTYGDAMRQMGAANDWRLGSRVYHADDQAVGQTYAELYLLDRDPTMIASMQAQFDEIIAHPKVAPTLAFRQRGATDLWSWCDALFMAPPAWMRLYGATGNARYRDFAVANWWRTSDYLYDQQRHLYFRDSTYFEKREANGEPVFWSRGNGWVIAGLVRVLQYLPGNDPERQRFENQFKEMAEAVLGCQQSDGLWRSSLLDPASYPLRETSGSGFYAYALAWGVNQGLLDAATYVPAVHRAWAGLIDCVAADGKLTHVQPVGADPKAFPQDRTEVYGVGAFLLAGSEVYRMAVLAAKPMRVSVSNPARFPRVTETVALDRRHLPTEPMVIDGRSSRVLVSQIVGDELLFQVDLNPAEQREYVVLPGSALAAVPPAPEKTFARFVPERMDDFAWENDRIAHRMYGPALVTGEGTISSGVDVWVKRTRKLVLNDWYAAEDYHEDHGQGLDGYKVGATRGCGGLGIWDGAKLWVSGNFAKQRVIATGPIRSVFELTYASWDAAGRKVAEVKRMSIDANSNFTRVESRFSSRDTAPLTIGVGVAKREGQGALAWDQQGGWLSYWEPEAPPHGHIACAIIIPGGAEGFADDSLNWLALTPIDPNEPLVFYFGAGWSQSGDFADAPAWNMAVRREAERLSQPLLLQMPGAGS